MDKILAAQRQASEATDAPAKMMQGLGDQMKHRNNRTLYYLDRIWVPLTGDVRTMIMDKAHKSRYSVQPGADKMYYDLRDMYWWPGMKRDKALYVNVGEGQLIRPELVPETTKKISQIKDRLKVVRDRQKSYAEKCRKALEFSVVPLDEIQVDAKLRFVEEPTEILKREFKKLKFLYCISCVMTIHSPSHLVFLPLSGCDNIAWELIEKYNMHPDEYWPEELDNIVGKKCLFKLFYSEYNVAKNNHTFHYDSFFEDVELINYFKNNFKDTEAYDEESSDDLAQSTTKKNKATIKDSRDKHDLDMDIASETGDSTSNVEDSSSKKRKLIIDLDEVESDPEEKGNISKA
nr:putative reverse transcriptase domain-containing protein [Tanacetum cinerariifolium]